MIFNLFNTRVCLSTEGKYCCLKIHFFVTKEHLKKSKLYFCPFSPFLPLKLVFLGETLSLFAISGSLHKSPAKTMMTMRIRDDGMWWCLCWCMWWWLWWYVMLMKTCGVSEAKGGYPTSISYKITPRDHLQIMPIMTMNAIKIMIRYHHWIKDGTNNDDAEDDYDDSDDYDDNDDDDANQSHLLS